MSNLILREVAVVYVAWKKTFGPILTFLLLAPLLLIVATWCFVVHNAAGQWTDDPVTTDGYCKLCGKDLSGFGPWFSAMIASVVDTVAAFALFALVRWLI